MPFMFLQMGTLGINSALRLTWSIGKVEIFIRSFPFDCWPPHFKLVHVECQCMINLGSIMIMEPGTASTLRPDPFPMPPYCLGRRRCVYSLINYHFITFASNLLMLTVFTTNLTLKLSSQIENRDAWKGAGSIGGGIFLIKAANSNADPGAIDRPI